MQSDTQNASINPSSINPYWIDAFRQQLVRCEAQQANSVALLSEPGTRPILLETMQLALQALSIDYQHSVAPHRAESGGPIIRSTGASAALNDQQYLTEALCQCEFIIDLTVEGLMHSAQTPTLLQSGARILTLCNEHPEVLSRLLPSDDDKPLVQAAASQCRAAQQMSVTSEHGSNLIVDMRNAATVGIWGWTTKAGTLAHWPGGLVVSFPAANTVNGVLVIAPGDINLTFKRYVDNPIQLTIENDFITDIDGSNSDTQLFKRYLQGFNDTNAYAVSHVGWGLNERARYEALTMYDKNDINGTELRALAGNFLFSTGANEFAQRFTAGHFDIPMMDCSITLDDRPVVSKGMLV